MLPITTLTAAVLMVAYMVLTINIMMFRRRTKITLLDGGNPHLQRRLRAQGNFTEYMPLALLGMLLLELQGAQPNALASLGMMLVIGRVVHAYGLLIGEPRYKDFRGRVFGMVCTWLAMGVMAGWLCATALF